jgi:hypothetical protein
MDSEDDDMTSEESFDQETAMWEIVEKAFAFTGIRPQLQVQSARAKHGVVVIVAVAVAVVATSASGVCTCR